MGKTELSDGHNFVDAAAEVKLPFFVWSGLEDVEKETSGKIKVPHFDIKGRITAYANSHKLKFAEVKLSYYSENWLAWSPPTFVNGTLTLTLPFDKTLDLFSVKDTGGVVTTILKNPDQHAGKSYGLASDTLTGKDITKAFKDATGLDVNVYQPSTKEFGAYKFPGAEELANMFEYYNVFAGKLRSPEKTKELYPGTTTIVDFLKKHKDVFTSIKKK